MSTERRLFIVALVAGIAARLLQTATSLGSLDAALWFRFAGIIERTGVLQSYAETTLMNHPPLALAIAKLTNRIGVAFGLEFQDSFRLLQIAADVVTALLLVRIARNVRAADGAFASFVFFLSPAVLFISAFHCNSDPLMMMFVTIAIAATLEERPALAGAALACAVGIKIVPLLAGPLFLFALKSRRARLQFLAASIVGAAVIFVPAIVVSGPRFLQQVFGYTGFVRAWGIPLLAHVLQVTTGVRVPLALLPAIMVAALVALWGAEWRRAVRVGTFDGARLPALVASTYLMVLFLAPGFGVQYLYWPLPFVAFALPRRAAIAFHAVVSAYLFAVYTVWSDGWPWWFANGTGSPRLGEALSKSGVALWVLIGIAAIAAVRRLQREEVTR